MKFARAFTMTLTAWTARLLALVFVLSVTIFDSRRAHYYPAVSFNGGCRHFWSVLTNLFASIMKQNQSIERMARNLPLPSQRVSTHIAASLGLASGITLSRISSPESACRISYALVVDSRGYK